MDIDVFRNSFPEFSDQTLYPSGQITFLSSIANANVNARRWGAQMYPIAIQLYVAHLLAIESRNPASGTAGGGPIASKAVGGASVSYDTSSTAEQNAGWWNLTPYGKQYYRYSRIYGSGAIQL